MVAAEWGETRDTDARSGGGVSGRFRLLGGSTEVPDTTPPPFGTAPWGYRRSEVDAWASWVAGLVAHGRNETIRADSAEATLRATLERLEQLERCPPVAEPGRPLPTRPPRDRTGSPVPDDDAAAPVTDEADEVAPDTAGPTIAGPTTAEPTSTAGRPGAGATADEPGTAGSDATTSTTTVPADGSGTRTSGRLHFDPPADLPRRTPRTTAADAARTPGTTSDPPPDHDLARLNVVETTLHEVLELLHHLADRRRA